MSEEDNFTYNGREYEVDTAQEFDDGSLVVTFKPVPDEEDEDIINA